MKLLVLAMILSLSCCYSLHAADLNITADEKVEWHQKEQKIVAFGNAVASKENMNIRADKLSGYYTGKEGSSAAKSSITKVEARGNVKLHSASADAFGNSMDYDLVQDVAVLRGSPSKIQTATETITAEDNITYYPSEQKAVAFGNVTAIDKDGHHLYSDKMVALFQKDSAGKLSLDKVEIFGNVKIVTEDATVTSDRGTYYPARGKIYLYENIVIEQDGNILRGDRAETDLNSGISKLVSASKTKRVKGVFKEKSDDTKSESK